MLAELFTDGGAGPTNPGYGGWGFVSRYMGDEVEGSGPGPNDETTNNQMEIEAAIRGLLSLPPTLVIVYSDSAYLVSGGNDWINNWKKKGWRTKSNSKVKNQASWERLDEQIQRHLKVKFKWVKGHNGHPENERAHELAEYQMRLQYGT